MRPPSFFLGEIWEGEKKVLINGFSIFLFEKKTKRKEKAGPNNKMVHPAGIVNNVEFQIYSLDLRKHIINWLSNDYMFQYFQTLNLVQRTYWIENARKTSKS